MGVAGVRFAGWSDDIRPWLATAADVVAMPSRWEAGLPLAAMEAMVRRRTVVAADAAGMRVIAERGCGAVVAIDAADKLAAGLARRAARPGPRRARGSGGACARESAFRIDAADERTAELYAQVLERRGGRIRR